MRPDLSRGLAKLLGFQPRDRERPPDAPAGAGARVPIGRCACARAGIVAATLAAYARGLGGRFLYDDVDSIPGNPSIRHLSSALMPAGRPDRQRQARPQPLVRRSTTRSRGRRSGATTRSTWRSTPRRRSSLFGIVRRTLATPPAGSRPGGECTGWRSRSALLWALHPLQTESVAYVVQRAESLMGLFYLLTLYAFVRCAAGGSGRRRLGRGVGRGLPARDGHQGGDGDGAGGRPPLRPHVSSPARSARHGAGAGRSTSRSPRAGCPWRSWSPATGGRGGNGGIRLGDPLVGLPAGPVQGRRALPAPGPVAPSARRRLWPDPPAETRSGVAVGAAVVLSLAAGTCVLLRRRPPLGFLGAWFLLVLAPSSSVIPVSTEIIAEHRMYLPLAAVVDARSPGAAGRCWGSRLFMAAVGLLALALGILTVRRNRSV